MTASANLDLVRSIAAAWEGGDFSSAEWAHPEFEYVRADGPGRWRRVSGMAEGFRDWLSAWEDYRSEAQEYREVDGERVLVLVRNSGRGVARQAGWSSPPTEHGELRRHEHN